MALTELNAKIYIYNTITEASMITEKVLEGMFKPVQSPWKTSITKVEPNKLTTRGYKQEDLIGDIFFRDGILIGKRRYSIGKK